MNRSNCRTLGLALAIVLASTFAMWPASAGADTLSIGGSNSCSIAADQSLSCWGGRLASFSILSLPDYFEAYDEVPRPVDGVAGNVTDVAVTTNHKCAVVDGSAFCWGINYGSFGGPSGNVLVAKPVPGFTSGVSDVAVAPGSTCVLKSGAVTCWGTIAWEESGSSSGTEIPGLGSGVTAISIAQDRGCAAVSGSAVCWGRDADLLGRDSGGSGILPPAIAAGLTSGVQSISVGTNSTCAVVNGAARCWGRNTNGQLGDGTTNDTSGANSRQVTGLSTGVQSVSVGDQNACAIVSGSAKCWGDNRDGTHGDETADDGGVSSVPVDVIGESAGVDAIALTKGRACARRSAVIRCWGRGTRLVWDLPETKTSPVEMLNSEGLEKISAGPGQICGIKATAVRCAGWPVSESERITGVFLKPLAAPFDGDVSAVVNGGQLCAIVSGIARCQGSKPNPTPELGPNVVAISSGQAEACATDSNVVRCWRPDGWTNAAPRTIEDVGSPVAALTSGNDFSCAIVSGGARCWGDNDRGQLGNDPWGAENHPPVTPEGLTAGVTSIAAGEMFACAVVSGSVKCWGNDAYGDLGNGPAYGTGKPTQVTGLTSGAVSVSVSGFTACALMVDGSIYCWGSNRSGVFGVGTTDEDWNELPELVSGPDPTIEELALGPNNRCVRTGELVKCVGTDFEGQLGIGAKFWSPKSIEIAPVGDRLPRVIINSPAKRTQYSELSVPVDIYTNFEGARECKLDNAAFSDCPDQLTNLSEGDHYLSVRATDESGSTLTTSNYFTYDRLTPVITLHDLEDNLDANAGERRFASFEVSEPIGFAAYCKVDDWEEVTCNPNTSYDLWFWPGVHSVTVRTADRGGRATAVTKTFQIGRPPFTGETAPRGTSTPLKPLATTRSKSALRLSFSASGKYSLGTRRLTARARLLNTDLQPGKNCSGIVRFARPSTVERDKPASLRLDGRGRCVASRTFRLRRSDKGTNGQFTAVYAGNYLFLPATRTGTKHL